MLQLVLKHAQGHVDSALDINFASRCFVHVGIRLHGLNQVGDAPGSFFDFACETEDLVIVHKDTQAVRGVFGSQKSCEW